MAAMAPPCCRDLPASFETGGANDDRSLENETKTAMRVALLIAALSIGFVTDVRADVVFSAPAYGGASQSIAVCYYSTARTRVVTFSKSAVVREDAVDLQEASESCTGGFSGGACRTVANISNNVAHYCEATVSSKKLVRGRLEIRNNAGVVLTTEEIK